MKQDLFDWLNSTHTDNTQNFSGTGGLLLAPVHNALPHNRKSYNLTLHQKNTYSVMMKTLRTTTQKRYAHIPAISAKTA